MIPARHAFIFLREDRFTDKLNDAQKMIYTNWAEAKEGEDPESSPSVQAADKDLWLFRRKLIFSATISPTGIRSFRLRSWAVWKRRKAKAD